jgi:DNA-directed RNA polymerase subunit N (RpoN/RPB10)
MCSPVRCNSCGKITWAGCGEHVDSVMADVPTEQRCTCK